LWLAEKESIEIQRNWSDRDANIQTIESYYEKLMSELENREQRFNIVQVIKSMMNKHSYSRF